MKKTVLTNLWLAGAKMFALFLLFVISMDVVAQATSNYLISIKARNLSWNYPNADVVPIIGTELPGDFGFIVGGQFYSLPEDFGPNTGNYVTNYNLGVSLNDIVWTGVVPVGASLAAPTANIIFQAYENDCGDLMSFDTGILDCGVNADESNVDQILFVDWASYVTLDADGQYVPGSYNISFGELGPFNGGDGSSYDVALQVTVVAVEPPLESCDLDVFPTGNDAVYECLSETEGQTSLTLSGGTEPYKIIGSGIYDPTTGDAFDFGVDPFGLEVPAGNFEFQVREGQPWTVTVIDATGCIVAQEGVMDLPNPDFNVPSPLCTTDPTVEIYEVNGAYIPPFAPLNGEFFGDAGVNDNGDNVSVSFDPFEAGPGVHLIAYCVEPAAGGGNGYGPGIYEEGCGICHTETIYVYPSFDGYDATGNLIVDIGLQTGGSAQSDAPLQVSYCLGHGDVTLGLTNYDNIAALFATLEPQFDADGLIDEDDFFITWSGPGITDNPNGTASLAFGWGANEMPLGAHAIQVTVGYPNCPTDKVVIVNVLPNFDATINDLATCSTEGEMFDLTGLFGATTTAGGYFYEVGAGGALTAIASGSIPNGDGTTVNILYSNTPDLTNVSQCNADDCINCDQATVTFSGFTVDASFAVAGGPEICRGASPLVDTVVDPLVSEGSTSGAQAIVGGAGLPATLTSTANLGIIDPYGHINSLEITLHYDGIAGNTQGDHDGWTVTLPGGVTFSEADGEGANGDNLFDRTITWAEIQAAYADAGLNIDDVYTGTNAPGLVGTCQPNDFEFELVTTSANSAISIDVDYSYVEPAGFVTAYIWSTGTQLPAEAISFNTETGEYTLNTLFTDADGNAWDLSTYLDIRVVHTTYSCDAQLPNGTLCTQSAEEIIKVLPALNATIADFTACANAGGIDLEQMFIAGTTSQGGTFSSDGGTLSGNYLTAGEGTYTITYTIGAGTGDDGCDPVPGTATLTVEEAADAEFNYPTTVCVGAIPSLDGLAASGTTSGLQVFNPEGNNISQAAFVAATVGGLYTITQTTGPAGCQDEYTHEVLVVESPTATSADATVCRSQAVVDLTQFVAGSTMGGNFSGNGVAGNVLVLGTLESSVVTYTVGSNGCTATTTFTVTIVDQPNADFDITDQICEGTTVNLYDYTLQDGGSFTDNGVAVATPAAHTFSGSGLHSIVYTIGTGTSCTATSQENVYVIDQSTVTAEYGFICQSGDDGDFEIDLSQQLVDGNNSPNGGTFTMRSVPPFISEIEYTGGPQIDACDFIEVTGPAGLDLANYVLVFYKRMDYTANNTFDDAVNSGAVYGVIDFADLQPNQTVGATTNNGTIIDSEVTGLNGIAYGSVGVKYFDATTSNPGNDVAPIGQTIAGIADGPAAVALVNKGETTKLRDLDRILGNDDVVQFIGYGTSMTNTNAGIFSACDGPARSLVPADINTVDGPGRSSQFTNICWVNPSVDDSEVAYATSPAPNVTSTGAGIPGYATVGDLTSAGSMNVGLRGDTPAEGYLAGRGHADEFYYEYIAPNGDILDLDRLCHVLFTGGQIINTADYVNPENGNTSGNANNYGNQVPSTLQVDGNTDDDNDGILDWEDSDFDNDGLQDDAGDAVSNLGDLDFDNDGIINSIDTDDDNDGLVDNGPGDTTVAFDSDGDGMVDSVDTDDDNDGLSDDIDTDNDTDGDGLANSSDPDDDNDGVLDAADSDDDNDGIPDMLDIDQDNDGLTDIADPDNDNDGLLDADDNDTDNDGISDANDTDDDNDGLSELVDDDDNGNGQIDGSSDNDKDADGLPDTSTADANNDGIVDNTATSSTPTYVNCATVDCDDDNDGISDFADPDDDNDGIKDSADPDDDNDGVSDVYDNDSQEPGYNPELYNDDDEVEFTCETMTYTIPFGYQLLPGSPGSTQCGSNQAIFYLTVLMDGEENWNNYSIDNPEGTLKTAVCDYSTTNLNTLIDDEVHWIAPIKAEGSVDESETFTFEENVKDPLITELKYKSYADGCSFTAADDHCVLYNYVDDSNTPFNGADDQYTNLQFCDGIEISAPVGTELSCYALVFYNNNDLLPQTPANGAAFDVTYIAANGLPATTKVSNGRYMQLYGLVDDDSNNGYPGGTIMTVPTWGLDAWNNYPYYAGANPYDPSNTYGQANAPGEAGLYIDTNENGAYDLNDYAIEGPTGFEMYDGASFPWERGTECEKEDVGARWFPIIDVPGNGLDEIGAVGLINTCTGKLVDFISWGGDICVETKEDCSCAGPFEQLSSAQIDTVQSTSCCDLRTLQLISASVAAELTGSSCPLNVADANGNVWVQVWNGGEYTIPGCGIYTADAEEFYQFSNSIGYYNCDLLEEAVAPGSPESFSLDLSDLDISDHYIVSNHTIEVTIGSQEQNYFQLYTYNISTGACGNLNGNDGDPGNVNVIPSNTPAGNNGVDLDENGNTNLITTVPGMTCGVPTHDNSVISDQAVGANGLLNSLEQAWDTNPNAINNLGSSYAYWDYDAPGVVNYLPGHSPANDNNPWSNGIQPSPIYMGTTIDNYGYPIYNGWGDDTPCMACSTDPNACIGDGEYAPAMYNASGSHTYNGSYDAQGNPVGPHALTFDFENGQGPLNIEGGCFDSFCTHLAKTTYTVSNLTAYLYNGNNIPGYEDGTIDSCRTLVHTRDHVTVTIRVKFDYHQCLPAGNFAGSDVNFNFDVNDEETRDMPYWTFEPNGLADISPVAITYNVTNAHPIEDDDATDDLACLDDDNDNVRTQDIEVLPSADASLSQSSISVCTNSPNVNLNQYVAGTPGGTWSGTGVSNNSFDPTTAGTFTATYSVEGCSDGASTATLTITVEQVGSVNLSGLATSVCSNDAITLPAGATWSGDGVDGSTFTPAGPGSYVLSYAAGSGDCGVSGTHTISVYAPLAVSTSEGEGNGPNSRSVTLTISGGLAPYTVNGMPIGGNTYTATLGCDVDYSFVVGSAATSCGTVPVFGHTAPCAPQCTAEAGQLFLVSGTIGSGSNVNSCANGTIVVNAAGFNGDAVQTYAATGADGNVIALSSTGVFNLINASGSVTFWGVNFCPGTSVPNTVSGIQAALGQSLQVTDGITVNIAPAITVELTAECNTASGGYFVRMTVCGGDPTLNGFGSYTSNCLQTAVSGDLIISGGETCTTVVLAADAQGTPFPAGASFSCSIGDGSLCEAAASIQMPATACGNNGVDPDSGFTLADTPVVIDVTDNDQGIVAVTSVTNPVHGTATINPNGTITYTPDPGFSGTDNFVYQGVDALGNTYTTNVTVVVQASSTALSATWDRDCSPVSAGDNEYVVTVYVQGGTAPYTISGSYNGILATAGPVSFSVLDGSGFQVVVTDNAGNQFPIDQSDIIACSKVAVDLLSFDGEVKTEGNYLTWATATETDNDYFTLEASRDGVNFEVINITDGAGNSNVAHNYNFMHKEAQNGVTYYRLSTTDFNGQVVHHNVITLVRGEVKFGIVELFPVPAVVDLSIKFTTAGAGAVKANIYSVAGQLVATKDVAAIKGMNTIKLDVANFAAGTYYVTLNDGNNVVTTKFVKQ